MSASKLSRPGSQRRQRGLAMVEFVISAPILLFILYCVVEMGEVLLQSSILADSARNADRYLARNALLGTTGVVNISGAVQGAAQNLAVYGNPAGIGAPVVPGLTPAAVTIAVDASNRVSVNIAHVYVSIVGGSIPLFFRNGAINTSDLIIGGYSATLPL
ncbi:MAG: TadE/TadG family type IV pilus assembly protein [Terriglobales bacterium]